MPELGLQSREPAGHLLSILLVVPKSRRAGLTLQISNPGAQTLRIQRLGNRLVLGLGLFQCLSKIHLCHTLSPLSRPAPHESASVFIPICLPVTAGFPPTGLAGSKAAEDGRDDKTSQQSHSYDQADDPGRIAAPTLPALPLMTVGTHSR